MASFSRRQSDSCIAKRSYQLGLLLLSSLSWTCFFFYINHPVIDQLKFGNCKYYDKFIKAILEQALDLISELQYSQGCALFVSLSKFHSQNLNNCVKSVKYLPSLLQLQKVKKFSRL